MKYYFELRKEKINKDGMIPIRLVVMNAKTRIRKSVEAKTKLEDWDRENNKINNPNSKFNTNYKEYQKSNKNIADIIQKVEKIFTYFEYNGIPFQASIFNEKFDEGDVKVTISFFDAYDEFVKISKLTKTSSTITKYNSVKNFLTAFELHSNHTLRLDTCDFRFEESFMDYCFNTRKTLNNYYAKIVKSLKAFLNWAYERGYHSSLNFKKLKSKEEDIEVIYLTSEELMKLYHHNFDNPALDRARDMWCLLAFTGQRHSDVYSLQNANIEDDYLHFTVKKTKTVNHHVYLIKQAKELIEKYRDTIYYPIPRLTSQKLNEKIQICCEKIGLTQEIELTRFIGAKRISQTFKKHELIGSHCGRKTFITNSLILGIPERVVRSISNHKDEKNFRKYVNISEIHKQKALSAWDSLN
ncbi:site-specific integrase [Chryseobacterium sp. C-71]|uniref:tyrosine-type recombinase/integrase n=1 Tax=Chryseobacterium sp. C-71 TaxID=2893882 RepID=UPI001E5FAA20|nr:tyrosine-type recombinase/integrase [Chryseobacterium sp. C-71]UFH33467.1 site-specific integrase [Chryseobacterium sp. C-71]